MTPTDTVVSEERLPLEDLFRPIEGMDRNQPGYHHSRGWNDAIKYCMDLRRAVRTATPQSGGMVVKRLADALQGLIDHVTINECRHEETHRGGMIWTICDHCGRKWADDQGGFVHYEEPPALTAAYAAIRSTLANPIPEAPADEEVEGAMLEKAVRDAHKTLMNTLDGDFGLWSSPAFAKAMEAIYPLWKRLDETLIALRRSTESDKPGRREAVLETVRAHKHTCANVQPGSTHADKCDCGALDTAGQVIPRSTTGGAK